MTCPSCGSAEARPIAPNWVECTGELRHTVQVGAVPVFGPGPYGALIGMDPRYETRTSVCGVRHHRVVDPRGNDTWAICACGTFAIGICRSCGAPVCGDDSSRLNGSRLCAACGNDVVSREQAQAAAVRQAEQERADAERDRTEGRARRQWDARVAQQADAIRRHGPCRAFPRHPAAYADEAGNCRACVVGLLS